MRWRWKRGLPTLTMRVVKALLLAFSLVFVVLMVRGLFDYREARVTQQRSLEAVHAVLDRLPQDTAAARDHMVAIDGIFNSIRDQTLPAWANLGQLQFELSPAQGGPPVWSSELLRKAPAPAPAQTASTADVMVDGHMYAAAQATQGAWRLRMLARIPDATTILLVLSSELAIPMLLAFPLVLLPMWWAVRQGLSPLRELGRWVQRRPPNDFSPMQLKLHYAELQPLEQSFNQLLAHSREAVGRERGFVQDAAHELRTPLAVIATQAHALVAAPAGPARQVAAQQMEHAIARASHQVHQLLTLARVEGPAERRKVDADCVELVRQILIDVEPQAKAQHVDLVLEAPERLLMSLDLVAFHSALENLVGNALKHAKRATRIQVSLQPRATRLLLSVADDGQGVAPQERPQLFERFHRGRAADVPGCGLGLAIVRESARLLGGEVRCLDGLDGKGLCFEMDLRLSPA